MLVLILMSFYSFIYWLYYWQVVTKRHIAAKVIWILELDVDNYIVCTPPQSPTLKEKGNLEYKKLINKPSACLL